MIYRLSVANIKCGGCAHSITKKLQTFTTIKNIAVDHEDGIVSFQADSSEDVNSVKEALAKMGYPEGDPTVMQTAKSFVSCAIGKVSKNL